jgi:SAM-dependent methyltransferase
MDTGGGERFLQLRPDWPSTVAVTESYPPNLRLVQERLAPLGVRVVDVELSDFGLMPFAYGEFDLVLNRHGGFNPDEVARILAPGGVFLTQQVHGLRAHDLHEIFGVEPQWPDARPEKYSPRLQAAGMTIVTLQEWSGKFTFTDVGALVYYLKAIPWTVPDFSVDRYRETLLRLHAQVERGEPLAFTDRKYLIEALKE